MLLVPSCDCSLLCILWALAKADTTKAMAMAMLMAMLMVMMMIKTEREAKSIKLTRRRRRPRRRRMRPRIRGRVKESVRTCGKVGWCMKLHCDQLMGMDKETETETESDTDGARLEHKLALQVGKNCVGITREGLARGTLPRVVRIFFFSCF